MDGYVLCCDLYSSHEFVNMHGSRYFWKFVNIHCTTNLNATIHIIRRYIQKMRSYQQSVVPFQKYQYEFLWPKKKKELNSLAILDFGAKYTNAP